MSDSIRTSVLKMVAAAFPALLYGHPRTYIVDAVQDDGRLDLVPPPDAQHLPPLRGVEQWAVAEMIPAKGTEVLVQFRDANPSRPVIIGARGGAGTEAVTAPGGALGATPPFTPLAAYAGRLARYGDSILAPAGSTPVSVAVFLVPGPTPTSVSRVKG